MDSPALSVVHLGLTEYGAALNLQRRSFELRQRGAIEDVLFLTEHLPVYTFGTSADVDHLLSSDEELTACGAKVFHVERGGDVTYHGPGQLVGYPILDLRGFHEDLHRYLRDLEEVLLRTIADYGIEGRRDDNFTGVWVGDEKIAAIGIRARRWVTMHGFALNVNTELRAFDRIIPCGIFHKGVTSLERLLGHTVAMEEVRERTSLHFEHVFHAQAVRCDTSEFMARLTNAATDGMTRRQTTQNLQEQ